MADDSPTYYSIVSQPPPKVSGKVAAHGTHIIKAHSDCGVKDPIGTEVVWKGNKALTVELLNNKSSPFGANVQKTVGPGKVELRVQDYIDRQFFIKITNPNDTPIEFEATVFAWVFVY
eukprot:TRINITY_DN3046_c0_g1_i1.p1 TRINITY_DN3046_c0_g1~~TRINITY_DN3046_c0_g1_i1.p1  ORF type:complete len:118 (-),score=13.29 TRINITY_DN3046_c0_g1_i1:33-386(-)